MKNGRTKKKLGSKLSARVRRLEVSKLERQASEVISHACAHIARAEYVAGALAVKLAKIELGVKPTKKEIFVLAQRILEKLDDEFYERPDVAKLSLAALKELGECIGAHGR